jgi:hypothetical protein
VLEGKPNVPFVVGLEKRGIFIGLFMKGDLAAYSFFYSSFSAY